MSSPCPSAGATMTLFTATPMSRNGGQHRVWIPLRSPRRSGWNPEDGSRARTKSLSLAQPQRGENPAGSSDRYAPAHEKPIDPLALVFRPCSFLFDAVLQHLTAERQIGWPHVLSDDEIMARLLALNQEPPK